MTVRILSQAGGAMKTKLTLRLDEELIRNAKEYSVQSGKSISRIVADLFGVIRNEKLNKEYRITPLVQSLRGVLAKKKTGEADYRKHLEEKYL